MSSTTGVNAGFAKCFILFMAIVILLQGIVYLGLSIWGLTMDSCSEQTTVINDNPFKFAIDILYFASEDCGYPNVIVPEINETIPIELDWSKSHIVTYREWVFMVTYIAVSATWILTSLIVLATICGRITNIISALCFWPWFLVVIAGSILDVVATGFHIKDIVHTTSVAETFDYIGVTITNNAVLDQLNSFDPYFVTPAIVMTCLSCRVVLIWLLNIFGTSFCLSISHVLGKAYASKRENKSSSSTMATATLEETIITAQEMPQQRQQPPPQQQMQEQYPSQIRPKPLPIQVAPPTLQRESSIQQQTPRSLYPAATSPTTEVIVLASTRPNEMGRPVSPVSDNRTYRNTETHPDRLNYPAQPSPVLPTAPSPTSLTSPEVLAISPLNNRYSTVEPSRYQPPSQPQRVSAELRSQLPWSYTSVQTKPIPPPKPQSHMPIYPEIPEPDYATPAGK